MEIKNFMFWRLGFLVLALTKISSATLSPSGINYEVVALMAIKSDLHDPYNVLENWDINYVDPCSWRMVTCSDGYVSALGLPSQSLSGTLSPRIGNPTNLQSVLLQNNAILGPIPSSLWKLEKLQTLDLSNNTLTGEIPDSLGELRNLNYLKRLFTMMNEIPTILRMKKRVIYWMRKMKTNMARPYVELVVTTMHQMNYGFDATYARSGSMGSV